MTKTIGKRAEYVALEIMEIGKPVTPSQIDSHTKTGAYSSKYISFLKRDGFVFQTNKDGRNVVSYTLLSRPEDSKLPPGAFDRPRASKVSTKTVPAKKAKETKKDEKAGKVKVKAVDTSPETIVLPPKKAVAAKKKVVVKETKGYEPARQERDGIFDDYSVQTDDSDIADVLSIMND
jgi:hypothetical protein